MFTQLVELDPISGGFGGLEGPVWFEGALLMTHIGKSQDNGPDPANILEYRGGQVSIYEADFGANGLALDPNGDLVAARQKDGTLTRVANREVIVGEYNGIRFNSPNDLVFSRQEHAYFTDPNWQSPKPDPQEAERVYHVTPGGNVTAFANGIFKPNGVIMSLDEKTLYVGGTNGLFKFAVNSDGSVVDTAQPVAALSGRGIDGMSIDCAGNIYVTVTSEQNLYVIANDSDELLAVHRLPYRVTNVAFGGDDGKTIFVTTNGSKQRLFSGRSMIPGFPF